MQEEEGAGRAGGLGGRLLSQGDVSIVLQGVPPLRFCDSGGPDKFSPGFPPSAARRARGGDLGWARGPGWRALGCGGMLKMLRGVPPLDCMCMGGSAKFCLPPPPLLQVMQEVGSLVGLVAWVGARLVGLVQYILQGSPPRIMSVWAPWKCFDMSSPFCCAACVR